MGDQEPIQLPVAPGTDTQPGPDGIALRADFSTGRSISFVVPIDMTDTEWCELATILLGPMRLHVLGARKADEEERRSVIPGVILPRRRLIVPS